MRKELIMRTFNSEIEVNDIDDAIYVVIEELDLSEQETEWLWGYAYEKV